jgi:alkanesulfonate monooxygenase SsuD/methylene tetrahydromethanopterin reductase-like flavin-dependent oxidoreductase (luciferase family)
VDAVGTPGARPLEFGTTGFYPPFEGAAIARTSEAMGFDVQMFSENHTRVPDAFGEMRDAARVTERIRLVCGPVNFTTRNPGVIASAIVPLQVLSAGRAVCGVASGDSAVAAVGRGPQPVAALERDITALRSYLHGQDVSYGDRSSRLEWAAGLDYTPVAIEMVCSGPRAIAVAARRADRIGLSVGANPAQIGWALQIIATTLAKSGRDRDSVRVGAFVPVAVTEDRATGRSAIRTRVAGWAHMSSFKGNDLSQQPEVMRRVTAVLRDTYDYRYHHPGAPADNPNTAVCDEEFGDWFGIGGPPSYVVDRLGELVDMGIDYFTTALPMPERERFAADVMPALRTLREPLTPPGGR